MPAVSLTVWLPVFRTCSPVLPPSPTLMASGSVTLSICKLNLPGSVLGSRSFLTSSLPVSRVLVITHTMSSPRVTGTVRGPASSLVVPATVSPLPLPSLHTIDLAYFARSVPRTALSPTVWSPVLSVRSPVVPPSPTFCDPAFGELPLIRRLKRPVSVLGLRSFWTSSLPVSRVLVIRHTMSESVVTGTVSGPASSPAGVSATTLPVPLSSRQTIDFW